MVSCQKPDYIQICVYRQTSSCRTERNKTLECVINFIFLSVNPLNLWALLNFLVRPCHHSMARPQVLEGVTASSMKGSCEYIE